VAVIEAHITKVEKDEGTGWYTVHLDHNEIKKLTTRQEGPAKEAAALRRDGAFAELDYTLREKPREGGGVFKNYYLNKARAAASRNGDSGDDGIEVVKQAAATRKTDPTDAWRMCLNKGGELAVSTMPLMPVEQRDFDTQKRLAFAWARYFFFTPAPAPEEVSRPGYNHEPDSYELPPPPTDDDIPF
jgi:hypothetical protein